MIFLRSLPSFQTLLPGERFGTWEADPHLHMCGTSAKLLDAAPGILAVCEGLGGQPIRTSGRCGGEPY
jgi:hypothetical protein